MADLRAKEDEIASLRETVGTRGQLSSDVSDTYSVLGAGHVCDCVCVCCGVIEEKGREKGIERNVTKRTRGWETFVHFTTRDSSVVKITCILRWTRVPCMLQYFALVQP